MFGFLRKIFEKEEKAALVKEVKIEELSAWLGDELSGIDLQEEVVDFLNLLKDKQWLLGEKITLLKEAELSEKEKVEEKVKSIVLGHRDNYVKEISHFLEKIEVPGPEDLREVFKFNGCLNKGLDELAQRTAKNYQAAQHLFFNEVEEVSKLLGEISSLAKDFDQRLEKKGLNEIPEIEGKIRLLQQGKKKKEKWEEELKEKEEKLKRCREGREKQEKEISRLKGSEDYGEFRSLKEKEEEIRKEMEKNKDEVYLFFSKLGRALRKYEKVTLEVKIVGGYLRDAVEAFFNDAELKVVGILDGLGRSMEKGEIELDEKEKGVVRELMAKAKVGHLKELQEKGRQLAEEKERIRRKLRGQQAELRLEEAEYKQEHFQEQQALVEGEIEELKSKLAALEGEKLAAELKGLLKEVLEVEVNLA